MKQNEIELYDTTLRDGGQSSDISFSNHDKIEIVKELDALGLDYIELGWPGSNKKDMEAFMLASKLKLAKAKIAAFGSTRKKGCKASDDQNLRAILNSKAKVACIFGKTWIEHVEKQLGMGKEEYLKAITDSIKYLTGEGLYVIYDLEHFFDGYKDNPDYAKACIKAAAGAGARTVVMCDTNGGALPGEFREIVKDTLAYMKKEKIRAGAGVHMHNDSGCAAANSIIAVELGVSHVQGTMNGIGERTGNADLTTILPALALKLKKKLSKVNLMSLSTAAGKIYTLSNMRPNPRQPYVGSHAFSHKGGIHVDAVMKGASYEHVDPKSVGNTRNVVLSELSGKANIVQIAKKFGFCAEKSDPRVSKMLEEVEDLENRGYSISGIDAEQLLLVKKHFSPGADKFLIDTWKVLSEQRGGEYSECVITGTVDGKEREVVATVKGGPVEAIFKALRKMIATNYKDIQSASLINYKVMIAKDQGEESSVRVYIEFADRGHEWATVGVSANILEASFEAIAKGFQYCLLKHFR